ncbi:alpha/beta hydrolase [Parapedobacter defluvii]|uniref:alpha/beta hydrolase n=1 Tax=Parapedobacter defluvii TaxID=2045106 RepID=UPI00333F91C2
MRWSALKISLFWMIISTCFSCADDGQAIGGKLGEERIANVTYGNHERHKMDVYLPENRSTDETGVIVLIHGGGFVAGDKTELEPVALKLMAKGFAVVNINYRLVDLAGVLDDPPVHQASPINIHHQLDDIAAAVELAWSKRTEWAVGDTWYIVGHSAGATLAMLHAYGEDNADGRIKATANLAGVTTFAFNDESEVDLLDPRLKELFYRIVGAEATNENKLAYMAASPYWVANNSGGVPTISVRPEDNTIGPIPDLSESQYNSLTTLLNSKGSASVHVEIAGAGHGFGEPGKWDEVVAETTAFFRAQ